MKANIVPVDKYTRIILAAIVVILYFTNVISGTLALALSIAARILFVTALLNFCQIWHFPGISAKQKTIQTK